MDAELDRDFEYLDDRDAARYKAQVLDAADAYAEGRYRDAVRTLEPVRDRVPGAPSVRELLGLARYRAGNFRAARRELAEFARITGSTEQHPVLMDCARAERRWKRVDELWEELRSVSPSGDLVVEGRIVMAGALADRGELDAAIRLLQQRARRVRRPGPADLRLLYALADLEERSGNLPRARALFAQVEGAEPELTDARDRLRALGGS